MSLSATSLTTDLTVLTYGSTAVVLTLLPTYLWHHVFSTNTNLNQVGFKVSAYSSFFSWLPAALVAPFFFLFRNLKFYNYFLQAMKVSYLGPWGYNLLSLYYLIGFSTGSSQNTVLFGIYNVCLMVF